MRHLVVIQFGIVVTLFTRSHDERMMVFQGTFLKKRAPFDFRRESAAPAGWDWHNPSPVTMKY